ncbi:hypothetical protein Tco_1215283 [Tanacetum coccineum]
MFASRLKKREYTGGKPSSQAVDLQVIRSIGEDVGGLMNSNLQGDKAGDGTTSMVRNTVNNWLRRLEEKRLQQQAATQFHTDAKRQF